MAIFSLEDIKQVIPHREPFIFIDEIIDFDFESRIVGVKRIDGTEWFFSGHFPGKPIMPGVLILEALAQTGCFFCLKSSKGAPPGSLLYLTRSDVRWSNLVVPPCEIYLEVVFVSAKLGFWFMNAKASVWGREVCSAKITAFAETPKSST
ncbi:MAG: 3-hydroxyacyl-ACP dehydratase FabZ [Deltaproteobacteria bacterium]|nr:3-hydroxyacyl-ACP dehydratase FabZ [Deltaproteobacteria bacterium]